MAFLETRLSDCVAAGFQVVPAYNTRIVPLDNGKEKRNANWPFAKRRFSAMYQNFTPADFAELLACFHVCLGSAYSFRFKDWSDYKATNEPLGNAPASGSAPVQLSKSYTFGGSTVTRAITKPVSATVYVAGVGKAGTVDTATGLFTPSTAWAGGGALTWTGEFDIAVRWASDEMPTSLETAGLMSTTAELIEDFVL